jgi:hypothetical protein
MERKKRETSAFFKEMENNIHMAFERAKKKDEEPLFTELQSEEMYEFVDEDNYHDRMDGMLRNSVNSYRDGEQDTLECFCCVKNSRFCPLMFVMNTQVILRIFMILTMASSAEAPLEAFVWCAQSPALMVSSIDESESADYLAGDSSCIT